MALPSNAQFSTKPTSVKIDRRSHVLPTLNKREYTSNTAYGETMIWYLPSLANTVMDGSTGYLRFTVNILNNTGEAVTYRLDQGGWSLFSSVRAYGAGGSLIEEITDYGLLYNALVDCSVDQSSKMGLSTAWGTEDTLSTLRSTQPAGALPNSGNAGVEYTALAISSNNRTGYSFGAIADGGSVSATFCIPILSALFALSEKVWPAYAFQDDTRFEIQLQTVAQALFCSANPAANNGTTLTVSNPEIVVDYLHMTPESMAQIQSFYANSDLVLHATSYRSYQSTLAQASTGNIQTILPAKLVSVKALYQTFRPQAHTTAYNAYSLSSRVCPFSSSTDRFSVNCGGESVPQHGIQTYIANNFDMFFMELQKSFHALNIMAIDGSLTRTMYNVNAQAFGAKPAPSDTTESYQNGFLLGVNMDSVIRSSELVLSGRDVSKITTYLEYRLSAPGPAYALTVNTFLYHDILFIVGQDGSCTARF